MSVNKVIIIFGLILIIFAGIVLSQFNSKVTQGPQTKNSVTINSHSFTVEVVKTTKDQEIGLTKYATLQPEQGMLFLFDKPNRYGFWMRGMQFPIDIIFIRNDVVVSFAENAQPLGDKEKPVIYYPESPSDKVLEISAGLGKNIISRKVLK